ncbi:3-phosphoglycerate kinase [Pseudomonas fulva]|uniref:3-phosphoglycerate kinase n=1 Tax=Pseudomonas fulva TaxID=47880 RepID=UPI00201DC762|nr:3-phosphoglycerate kinase [Pseudomonas fulva]UQY35364.1 3-phosphoglycerate kinase [Pseudomonas fulva]
MKKLCCALIACVPLAVQAYPIELEKQFNGAEVSASTQEIDHNMAAVRVQNFGQQAAACKAVFRNGPEAPRTRSVKLAAGQSGNLTVKFARSIIRLRVQLDCQPQ